MALPAAAEDELSETSPEASEESESESSHSIDVREHVETAQLSGSDVLQV